MATQTSTVGKTTYPLSPGVADDSFTNEAFNDPLVEVIASYLAHYLNADLNARLFALRGRADEAVPEGSTFFYNPGRTFVRESVPALYVWRDKALVLPWSTVTNELRSTVRAYYIFEKLTKPADAAAMNFLFGAVASVLARATSICRHATWQFGTSSIGSDIRQVANIDGWALAGDLQFIEAMPEPGEKPVSAARNSGGDSAKQTFFPIVHATWLVREFISPSQAEQLNAGGTAAINLEGVDLEDRFIPHPGPTLPDPP